MKDIYTEFYDVAKKELGKDLLVFISNGMQCVPTTNSYAYSLGTDIIDFVGNYLEEYAEDFDVEFTVEDLFNIEKAIENAIDWGNINEFQWDDYRDIVYDYVLRNK